MAEFDARHFEITCCEYIIVEERLHVEGIGCSTGVQLELYLTSADQRIGVLYEAGTGRYSARLVWHTIPGNITVKDKLGCLARAPVILK